MPTPPQPRPPADRDKAHDEPTAVRSEESSSNANLGGPDEPRFAAPTRAGELGTFGRYRVLQKLGHGGMGAVYLGFDGALDRKIALKVMLPQFAASRIARERFLREARSAAKIKSDHVVTIFDVGEERGAPFIAMEYLFGFPLNLFLKTRGELPLAQVLRVARETAEGLAAAHDLGVIHRDIKPGNIWLEAPRGRVKILDFGLARSADDDASLTGTGAVMGTPAYMSPEQARGLKVDHRSDLFSLGVMLYRLTTGTLPFSGNSQMAILTSLAVDTPVAPREHNPQLPAAVEAVILRLLARNPDERFPSAHAVAAAIAEIENPMASSGTFPVVVPQSFAPGELAPNVWEGIDASGSTSVPAISEVSSEVAPAHPPKTPRPAPRRRVPKWPLLLVASGLLAALAVAVVFLRPARGSLVVLDAEPDVELIIKKNGQVVHDRTADREFTLEAGTYTVEFADPRPGLKLDPDKVDVTKGGTARVRVAGEKPKPPALGLSAADRRAVEYTFSVGGHIRIPGQDRVHRSTAELPKEPFVFVASFEKYKWADDAKLVVFRDSQSLVGFVAPGSNVSDAGLSYLRGCTALKWLDLRDTPTVGDTGLATFKNCKKLEHVNLANLPKMTIAGLAHFKDCANLTFLDLSNNNITDAGLVYLENLAKLTELYLKGTKVSESAVKKLADKLPKCRIEWNGAAIEPRETPDTTAAAAVLALGGSVRISGTATDIRKLADLPKEPFWLTDISFQSNTRVTDADLALLSGREHLIELNLNSTTIGGAGLVHLKNCKNLTTLFLVGAPVSDGALVHLRDCRKLSTLFLSSTRVTADGLAHLKELKSLTALDLNYLPVADAALEHIKDCQNLKSLGLYQTQVTDGAVARLKRFERLTDLDLRKTAVTAKGIDELAKALPGCKIQWDRGTIEPKK